METSEFAKFKYQNTEFWLNVVDENNYMYIRMSNIESVEIIPSDKFIVRATMISGRIYIIAECQTMESARDVVDKTLKLISNPKDPKELTYVNLRRI